MNDDYTDISDLDVRLTVKRIVQCQGCHPSFVEEFPSLTIDEGAGGDTDNKNGGTQHPQRIL